MEGFWFVTLDVKLDERGRRRGGRELVDGATRDFVFAHADAGGRSARRFHVDGARPVAQRAGERVNPASHVAWQSADVLLQLLVVLRVRLERKHLSESPAAARS